MKKAQAALEFLMTYGWAILVVLVVIGALAYFGVLNPSILLPERCTLQLGMNCKNHLIDVNGDAIFLQLENGLGKGMIIKSINITGDVMDTCYINTTYRPLTGTYGEHIGLHLPVGKSVDLTVHCINIERIGTKTKGDIAISWLEDDAPEVFTHTMGGEILAKTETGREEKCCCDFQSTGYSNNGWFPKSACESIPLSCTGDDFFACAISQEVCCEAATGDTFWMDEASCPDPAEVPDSECEY